ncbi:MAG: septum formation initiator [Puniceicoccaceae bacterium MED-G30]|jgi:cell division protein DivIC|nr:MAG: septum formation initiator [Puniceicoccaceae bacterium MED-G30]RPG83621.1 MAG: septum formation initiator family protein [Coraliomargarita sp. TMED73]|tara:strand:+ start:298 stop:603 length:306 start_codon:yes stop_codon:yes gene_type:complete
MRENQPNRKERVILWMALATLLILGVFLGSMMLQTRREYRHFIDRRAGLENRLAQAHNEFRTKEAYYARLLEDPEFLERVARERLGYSRPDEVLFRFDDEP